MESIWTGSLTLYDPHLPLQWALIGSLLLSTDATEGRHLRVRIRIAVSPCPVRWPASSAELKSGIIRATLAETPSAHRNCSFTGLTCKALPARTRRFPNRHPCHLDECHKYGIPRCLSKERSRRQAAMLVHSCGWRCQEFRLPSRSQYHPL